MNKRNLYIPILLFATLALGVLLGGILNFPIDRPTSINNSHKNKLNRLLEFINTEYVDQIDTDSIVDLTVTNILAQLDPHSVYVPPSEQADLAESMRGNFVGVGINFFMFNDTISVINPIENGPSERAGIQSGDRILFVDKLKMFGKKLPFYKLFPKFKGEEGSQVELTIFRKKENKIFKVKITREVIPLHSIDVSVMLNSNTGYIKINRFSETTYKEFDNDLIKLKQSGAKSIIIDVRENGGGYMETATKIVDEFLKDNELIVFTKNKKGEVEKTFATKNGQFETGKVAVLIDENSASASEILAGAIQDNDRGIIVGRRSFGKGLVQREMNFEDGSAVRLTVARYYTPSGRSIQKHYIKGNEIAYQNDFNTRFLNGELYEKDSIKIADTLKFKSSKGNILYGGGGIVPDIFVPLEGNRGEESIVYIVEQTEIIDHFVFEQLDKSFKDFKKVTYKMFLVKMENTEQYFNAFQKYLEIEGVQLNLSKNKLLVKRYITAEFAKQLYGKQKYYEIILKEDPMVLSVLNQK